MEMISGAGKNTGRLKLALALTSTYLVVEVIGGIVTGSLALLADAGHMLTDVAGMALALFAIWFASKPATPERTYGFYRAEILAAMTNAIVLFFISGYILYEAWQRFQEPQVVESGPMVIVATVGLIVNIVSAWMLRSSSEESLNMRGAYLEVISDMLGSIGVIIAAAIIYFTGWYYADPLFSVFIGLFIIPRTWTLLRESIAVLLEGTPANINLAEVRTALESVPGVDMVHDLHVWSITSGVDALSAHARINDAAAPAATLAALNRTIKERFKIEHTTIQLEQPGFEETQRPF